MRIILINPNPLPSSDPESLQVIHTAVSLAKGVELYLIVSKGLKESLEEYYGPKIPDSLHLYLLPSFKIRLEPLRLSWNLPFFLLGLFKIVHLARTRRIDAILVRNLKLGHFLLRWQALFSLPPIIFETHEVFTLSFEEEMRRKGKGSLRKRKRLARREDYVYRNADGIICISHYLKDTILKRSGSKGPVLVAPSGVDLTPFQGTLKPSSMRDVKPHNTILYMGSLHHWKGVDILLKAMQCIPEAFLKIVGGSPEKIRCYKDLAEGLGLGRRVAFEGFVTPSRRYSIFNDADVCVLPLRSAKVAVYSSPIKLFEYMSSGVPIVASDLPAIREIIRNNVNGILVPPEDPEELARGIRYILDNPQVGKGLAHQARIDVEGYTWDRRAEKIKEFVELNWGVS